MTLALTPTAALAAADQPAPLLIEVVGDSISSGCGNSPPSSWCHYFDEHLNDAGIPHVITAHAVPGWTCSRLWTDGYVASLEANNPKLVIIACGTNDAPSDDSGDAQLGWAWRNMVESAYNHGAKVLPAFIQYSVPDIQDAAGRSWLVPGEIRANNAIWANWTLYRSTAIFAGLVDFQRVPGTRTYLDAGGIHPNSLGNRVMGALVYRALKDGYGWPDVVAQPCGLWGFKPGTQPAEYTPCTGTLPGLDEQGIQ
jgi:lysophospholipase L1-like esterase